MHAALGIGPGDIAAFVGAGGKSSAIAMVAQELQEAGSTVIVAPTTKMFTSETEKIGPVVVSEDLDELCSSARSELGDGPGAVVAGTGVISGERIGGVEPGWIGALSELAEVVLVEADGSRRRPLKGTADHEPILPENPTLVVAVGGIWALGKPVEEEFIHRPEVFTEITGVGSGHSVTARAFATALVRGSLGSVPSNVQQAVLLTGVEPGRTMSDASTVAHELWRYGLFRVVLSSIPKNSAQIWAL